LDVNKVFDLATPILEKNDFGVCHTRRVFEIAKANFSVTPELEDLTYVAIILHDIGGCTIKDQYEKGPPLAEEILKKLDYSEIFIKQVCEIIATHHDHPDRPTEPFKILYDSDKIVMFTPEEYPTYNSREGFDWTKIIGLIYTKKGKEIAERMLVQRRKERVA
jgi:hypothetical protein